MALFRGRLRPRLLRELHGRQQAGADTVVDVVVVVRDRVGQIGELGFQTRLLPCKEAFADFAQLFCVPRGTMLEDTLAGFEHQVQAGEVGVLGLQVVDDAQRLQIVLEAAVVAHAGVECVLAGVAERRMAQIVRQRDRLDQRFVQAQRVRHGARDLRHFE